MIVQSLLFNPGISPFIHDPCKGETSLINERKNNIRKKRNGGSNLGSKAKYRSKWLATYTINT
jgi:hypothetical protein